MSPPHANALQSVLFCLVLACPFGCGGSATPGAPTVISVGGDYALTKTVVEDTCGGPLVSFTLQARVAHAPGAGSFVLNDSFNELPGMLARDGTFTIASLRTGTHQGAGVTSSFTAGRFTTTGFEVRVRSDVDGPSGTPPFHECHAVEAWRGLKQGSPNVLP